MSDRDRPSDRPSGGRPPEPPAGPRRTAQERPAGVGSTDNPRSPVDPLSDAQTVADSRLSPWQIERLPADRILPAKLARLRRMRHGRRSALSKEQFRERAARLVDRVLRGKRERLPDIEVKPEPVDGKTKAAGNGGE